MITLSNEQPQHPDYSHWRELGLFGKMTDFRFGAGMYKVSLGHLVEAEVIQVTKE